MLYKHNHIQAVIFEKDKFTTGEALNWIKTHNYKPISARETRNFLRYRIQEPSEENKYRLFRVGDGIKFVLQYPKNEVQGGAMKLMSAYKLANSIKKKIPGLILTGSILRNHPVVNDIDFLTLRPLSEIKYDLERKLGNIKVLKSGNKILSIDFNKMKIDFWHIPSRDLLPFFKLEYDLGKKNIKYKTIARNKGYKLSVKGLKNLETDEFVEGLKSIDEIIDYIENKI
jgi:hypothetical protein